MDEQEQRDKLNIELGLLSGRADELIAQKTGLQLQLRTLDERILGLNSKAVQVRGNLQKKEEMNSGGVQRVVQSEAKL